MNLIWFDVVGWTLARFSFLGLTPRDERTRPRGRLACGRFGSRVPFI